MTTQRDNEKHWNNQHEVLETMAGIEAQWEADNKSKQSRINELEKQNDLMREALCEINMICFVCKQDIKDINTIYFKSKTALTTVKVE